MKTYTIVYDKAANLLVACFRDGDFATFNRENEQYQRTMSPGHEPVAVVVQGCTLTNTMPEDDSRIVWRGHDRGWLSDETGEAFEYAVKA